MAFTCSVFQPTIVRCKKGKKCKVKGRIWWIAWRDEAGVLHRKSIGTRIKRVAEQYAMQCEVRFAQGNLGLVDPFARGRKQPIQEHVADYKRYLADQGRTPGYIKTTVQRIELVVTVAKIKAVTDISPSEVEKALAKIAKERDLATAGRNHYLRSIKMLLSFMVADRRISADGDPLGRLHLRNTDSDRRRERRALTEAEFHRLIKTTAEGPNRGNLTGTDRAMIYLVASYSGFRRASLASLTPAHFQLSASPPTVLLAAKDAKNRKRTLPKPLGPELVAMLREYFSARGLGPTDIIWPIKRTRTADLVRADLEAAGVEYEVDGLVVDFHALRGGFATSLERAGVSLASAQTLMDHSDPKLTSNAYTHSTVVDLAKAIAKLPSPPVIKIA